MFLTGFIRFTYTVAISHKESLGQNMFISCVCSLSLSTLQYKGWEWADGEREGYLLCPIDERWAAIWTSMKFYSPSLLSTPPESIWGSSHLWDWFQMKSSVMLDVNTSSQHRYSEMYIIHDEESVCRKCEGWPFRANISLPIHLLNIQHSTLTLSLTNFIIVYVNILFK